MARQLRLRKKWWLLDFMVKVWTHMFVYERAHDAYEWQNVAKGEEWNMQVKSEE